MQSPRCRSAPFCAYFHQLQCSVTTKGPWLEQYSCPFSLLVELVNKANCYTLWAGQMNQILSCDWLPERARWSPILSSRDCSQYPAKKFPRILYWSSSLGLRWLDIGHAKKNLSKSSRLDLTPDPADEGWHGNRCVTSARHGIYAWIYLRVITTM